MNRRELMVGTAAASVVAALPALPQFMPEDCFTTDNLLVKCWEIYRYASDIVASRGNEGLVRACEWRAYMPDGVEHKVVFDFEDGSTLSLPDPAAEILESASIRRGLPL